MAIDLTRFDFNAKKFYFSEDVQAMSAEEVGQYILLLVASWMGGKDASLPDNPALLARMARSPQVSESVLAKFPLVETPEHGARRRNETLYDEWLEALGRSLNRAENGKTGGLSTSPAKVAAAQENGRKHTARVLVSTATEGSSETEAEPKPNLSETETSNPNQTNPIRSNQTKPNQDDVEDFSSKSATPDWKNLALRYRNVFGKKAGAEFKKKFYDACEKYTEEVVLECFDLWATDGKRDWCEANSFDKPLHLFFKKLPEEAEDALDVNLEMKRQNAEKVEHKKLADAAQEASIAQQNIAIIEQWAVKPQTNMEDPNDFFKE